MSGIIPPRASLGLLALMLAMPLAAQTTRPLAPASAEPAPIRVLLSPELETTLVSQMVGRITTLNGSLGSAVGKGKTIIQMDCSEAAARLRMAEAELVAAKQTLDAKTQMRELAAAGDVEVKLAAAAADKARGQIALTRTQMSQCAITAPFAGRIAKLHVKPHQGVNVGTPLVDLVSGGPLKLRLNVPSLLLRQLKVGSRFDVSIDETGKTYPARVTAINARVDAVAQTIELEARIDGNAPDLLPGMSGTARFTAH